MMDLTVSPMRKRECRVHRPSTLRNSLKNRQRQKHPLQSIMPTMTSHLLSQTAIHRTARTSSAQPVDLTANRHFLPANGQ